MTLDYRSPHQRRKPDSFLQSNGAVFAANPTPQPLPAGAFGAEWLMAHVVDVIAAGPLYDGKLSPVWAQMVRLYAQYLGVIPKRAAPAADERSPKRRALEKELKALIPAIADLIEAQERDEQDDDEEDSAEVEEEQTTEEPPSPSPPSPEDLAVAEAYELYPISRLEDDEVMAEALGRLPKPESLQRALKLALDGCAQRARFLRGPLAELSPRAVFLADRLARRWDALFVDPQRLKRPPPPHPDELDPDLFETRFETYRRRYFPPSGSPPN
ncbi:MAG: hypothetical protein ACOVVK_00325 [Elsteraceae bacterium]